MVRVLRAAQTRVVAAVKDHKTAGLAALEVVGCAAISVNVGLVAGFAWAIGAGGVFAIVLANTNGET